MISIEGRVRRAAKELRAWADDDGKTPDEIRKLLWEIDAPGVERAFKAAKEALGWKDDGEMKDGPGKDNGEKAKGASRNDGKDSSKKDKKKPSSKKMKDGKKRDYTHKLPLAGEIDAWAAAWGVDVPEDIPRQSRTKLAKKVCEAAAAAHDVDLGDLTDKDWKDTGLPRRLKVQIDEAIAKKEPGEVSVEESQASG